MSKIRSLATIGLSDLIGNGITAVFWFYLATLIEPKGYGELSYFLGIAGIISYISLIGTQNTITVYTAKKVNLQSTFYLLSLIGGTISFIVIGFVFNRLDVGLLVFGYIIMNLVIGEILGRRLYNSYSKYMLIQKILTLILGIVFYHIFGINGVIYGLALSYIVFTVRIYKEFRNTKLDFGLLKSRFGFTVNNYITVLAGSFNGQVDKLIIMPLLGSTLLGNYALALQVISVLIILPGIMYKYILPEDVIGKNNRNLKKLTVFVSVCLTIVGIVIIPEIISTIFTKYDNAIEAIQIMSLAIVPYTINKVYISKFLSMEKSRFVLISILISLAIIISGTIIFGTMYNINGVAVAFVLSQIGQTIFFIYVNYFFIKKTS